MSRLVEEDFVQACRALDEVLADKDGAVFLLVTVSINDNGTSNLRVAGNVQRHLTIDFIKSVVKEMENGVEEK